MVGQVMKSFNAFHSFLHRKKDHIRSSQCVLLCVSWCVAPKLIFERCNNKVGSQRGRGNSDVQLFSRDGFSEN